MKNLKKLMERREELKQQLAALVDAADQEERAMTEEETRAFDAAEKEIQDIDDTLAREERARNIPTVQQPTEQHEMTVEERAAAEEKAFADFIMNRAMENRAGEIQLTQGNNGSIVPTTIANRIIKAVRGTWSPSCSSLMWSIPTASCLCLCMARTPPITSMLIMWTRALI